MTVNWFRLIINLMVIIILQVFVFAEMTLLSNYIALPYVLLILMFPINYNIKGFYVWSFVTGFLIDWFFDTGGIHATASLILAALRNYLIQLSFGVNLQFMTEKIDFSFKKETILFVTISVFIHHFIVFFLQLLSFVKLFSVLQYALFTSVYTLIVMLLLYLIFKPNNK